MHPLHHLHVHMYKRKTTKIQQLVFSCSIHYTIENGMGGMLRILPCTTIIYQSALKNMVIITIVCYVFSKPLGTTSVINKQHNHHPTISSLSLLMEQFINGNVNHQGHIIIYSYENPLQETKALQEKQEKKREKKGREQPTKQEEQNDHEMLPGEETEVGFHLEV